MPGSPVGYVLIPLNRTGWLASSNDVYYGAAANVLDGNNSTIWATNGTIPCWCTIDMANPTPSGYGGNSISAPLIAGALTVVSVHWEGALGTPTISDGTNTYNAIVALQHPTVTLNLAIFAFVPVSTATFTITTTANNSFLQMIYQQFYGVSSVAVDASVSGTGSGASVSSGSLTTTNASDLLVATCCGYHNAAVFTAGSGWTAGPMINGADCGGLEYQQVSATGPYTGTFGYNSDYWVCIEVAFKGTTGAPPYPTFDTVTVLPRQDGWADDPGSITINVSNDGSTWTAVYSQTGIPLSASLKYFGPFSGGAVTYRYMQYYISVIATGARVYQGACEINVGTTVALYATAENVAPPITNANMGAMHQASASGRTIITAFNADVQAKHQLVKTAPVAPHH